MTASALPRTQGPWSPDGFDEFQREFPHTPPQVATADRGLTATFIDHWRAGPSSDAMLRLRRRAPQTTVVFVRGFLGNYMPGNLVLAARELRRLGFDAFIARNRAGATVDDNVKSIERHLHARRLRNRLVFCGHSRGGVESLTLLASRNDLASQCDGVAAAQMPFAQSRVLESMLLGAHRESLRGTRRRAAEAVQRAGLELIGAAPGGRELGGDGWARCVDRIAHVAWPFVVAQVATWSIRPTAWLDSFHQRLGEIAPGRAHDGQFYLDEALWPSLPHVLLPHVDHAQPAVGGFGFDTARFWSTLLTTLDTIDRRGLPSSTGPQS